VIVASEEKPNAKGTGSYLELRFQVVEGPHSGTSVWARLNLKHPSAVAVGIARSELAAICRAVAQPQPRLSADLHDVPLGISVRVKKRADTGGLINEVESYCSRSDFDAEWHAPDTDPEGGSSCRS